MTDSDITRMSVRQLTSAYRAKTLSPVEVTQAALAKIDALNGTYGAYCLVDAESALASARRSETRWMQGAPLGPIDGITASIKDICLTRGWPTFRGSNSVDPAGPWAEDAPCTARLIEAGAVLLGKTTTPERGWKGVTDNPRGDVARNPHDPNMTAGGSSGGAAVAAALGMGSLHIGTDGGGSIRIPAAFSGVFGIKPTFGRVPAWPASPYGDVAHVGPITRLVEDSALMLDVISRPDPRDWLALPPPSASFADGLNGGIAGLRIGYSPDLGFVQVDPDVAALVAQAIETLRDLGAEIVDADLHLQDPIEIFNAHWYSGAAQSLQGLTPDQLAQTDPGLIEIAAIGAAIPHMDYMAAMLERAAFARTLSLAFNRFDLLVTPAMPIAAFKAGQEVPTGWPHKRWTSWSGFTYPFNLSQQPAASVPCGMTAAGLPVGLQIVAPRHADHRVLLAARSFEAATT